MHQCMFVVCVCVGSVGISMFEYFVIVLLLFQRSCAIVLCLEDGEDGWCGKCVTSHDKILCHLCRVSWVWFYLCLMSTSIFLKPKISKYFS